MTGRAMFNEVFLDEARVDDAALIGGLNQGWAAAMTTLANERAGLGGGGGGAAISAAIPGTKAGMLERRAGDFAGSRRRGTGAVLGGGSRMKLLRDLAESSGADQDPILRQRLMELYTLEEISRYTVLRLKAAKAQGKAPGPEANTAKLTMSRMTRLSREIGLAILGPHGTLMGPDTPSGGVVQEMALFSPAVSIYGGSDEVQRNIIGERVLGLPKEPNEDKTTPFKDLRVGTQAR
jgi:alkylation response protein AidB-like acyl-CoA dehydrogenase